MLLYKLPVLLACVSLMGYSAPDGEDEHVWAVKVQGKERSDEEVRALADSVASSLGLANHGKIEPFLNVFRFGGDSQKIGRSTVGTVHASLREHPAVVWASLQHPLIRTTRNVEFTDPYYPRQWHLANRYYSHDINVTGVWSENITGMGVVVAVVDSGLEHTNEDISQNYNALGSYDFVDDDEDPMPDFNDTDLKTAQDTAHGTNCAGLIAAVANEVCGVGVAYRAQVSGIRLLDNKMTDIQEAKSFVHKAHTNWIYSCSWGPKENGTVVEGPGYLTQEALQLAVSRGRYGYGNIFVFAAGNGRTNGDNCNYDGYANSVYTIAVGAIDVWNHRPYYAELCPPMLAVTYSGNSYGINIVTTDVSINKGCTQSFSGTSAATAIASGMIALMLQVRPCLSWRDVQALLVYTAVKLEGVQWVRNAAGFQHSDEYGFGLMDAYRMSRAAGVWPLLSGVQLVSFTQTPHMRIFQTVRMTKTVGVVDIPSEFHTLEYVAVTVTVDHSCRGALEFTLISPHNTSSTLATTRKHDNTVDGLDDWTFTTVKFWGEMPQGKWTLAITDHPHICPHKSHRGVLKKWVLTLRGSNITHMEIKERIRLVEKAVSSGTVWSPLPCPPLPSHPQGLSELVPLTVDEKESLLMGATIVYVLFAFITLCFQQRRRQHHTSISAAQFTRKCNECVQPHTQCEETVQLLKDEEESVEVVSEVGRSEEITLLSDEPEENAPFLLAPTTSHTSFSSPKPSQLEADKTVPDTEPSAAQKLLTDSVVEVETYHSTSSDQLGSCNNGSPPTSGIHGN